MKKNHLLLVLLPAFLLLTGALQFPVGEILLTAVFGESRGAHLHNGIDLGRGGQAVFPVRAGEIVFYTDAKDHPLIGLFGNGNLVVMQHPGGARSYYYHLEEGTEGKRKTLGQCPIGISATARSIRAHLHLSWTRDAFLNPLRQAAARQGHVSRRSFHHFIVGKREITIRQNQVDGLMILPWRPGP